MYFVILCWAVECEIWAPKQNHLRTTVRIHIYAHFMHYLLLKCKKLLLFSSSEWQLTINAALVPFCGCRQIIMIVMTNATETKVIIRIIHHSSIRPACTPLVMITLRITANTTRNHIKSKNEVEKRVSMKSF